MNFDKRILKLLANCMLVSAYVSCFDGCIYGMQRGVSKEEKKDRRQRIQAKAVPKKDNKRVKEKEKKEIKEDNKKTEKKEEKEKTRKKEIKAIKAQQRKENIAWEIQMKAKEKAKRNSNDWMKKKYAGPVCTDDNPENEKDEWKDTLKTIIDSTPKVKEMLHGQDLVHLLNLLYQSVDIADETLIKYPLLTNMPTNAITNEYVYSEVEKKHIISRLNSNLQAQKSQKRLNEPSFQNLNSFLKSSTGDNLVDRIYKNLLNSYC